MPTKTVCCKLSTTDEQSRALVDTSRRYSDACNLVLQRAIVEKTHNPIKLHKLCYNEIRECFGLSANLAVRAIRRVSGNLTRLQGARKRPRRFQPRSVDYDARIFSFWGQKELVSLTTTQGRIRLPMVLGDFQRGALEGQTPTSATVINKGGVWYIHIVVEYNSETALGDGVMGIDLGITNIVATSTGHLEQGDSRQTYKAKRAAIRASLQSKGTRGARRLLRKLSGRENRSIRHQNHLLSKQLIEEAKRHKCGVIRMEQLKGIRSRTKTWNKHRNRMVSGWSFYQLQQFVLYKGNAVGITVEWIDPAYTSQTCHSCLQLGSREWEQFCCTTCGDCHADFNAACVISLGGAVCKPARISSAS
ncbi:MAG: RNA-guided endonuclease InsQ/TnpB family protein [Parachlamydiales bacterium]